MAVQAGVIQTTLSANVGQFNSSMRSAQNAFQNTVTTVNNGAKSMSSGFAQIKNATESVEVAVNKLQRTFTRGMSAIGASFILPSIFSAAKDAIVGFNQQLDSATIAMETFVGSKEGAQEMLGTLQDFAARTPFNFSDLLSTSQQMMAMGVEAKELVPRLTAIGDAAAALGGSPEILQRVQRALGQITAKGRVQAEELMQLAEVGIPAYEYIAEVTGGSIPDALDLMKKGQIDAATAVTALLDGMTRDFSGMMASQSQTMMGALSTVQDYAQMTVAKLGRPLFEAVRGAMLKVANFLSQPKTVQAAEKFAENFAKALRSIGEMAGRLASQVAPMFKQALATAVDLTKALISGLSGSAPILLALGAAVVGVAQAFKLALGAIAPLVKMLAEHKSLAVALVTLLGIMAVKNKLFGQTAEGAARAGTRFVGSLKESIANIKDTIAYQQKLAAGAGTSLTRFQAFGAGVRSSFMAARAAAVSFMASVLPILALTAAITAITKLYTAWSDRNKDLDQRTKDFTASLKENTDALLSNVEALKAGENGSKVIAESFGVAGDAASSLTTAFGLLGKAYDFNTFLKFADSFDKQAMAILKAKGVSDEMSKTVLDMVNAYDKGNDSAGTFARTLWTEFGDNPAPQSLIDTAVALEKIQDQIEATDFSKVVAEQARQMVGSGQLTLAIVAQAQASADLIVKQRGLGESAAAVVFGQQLLAAATDYARRNMEYAAMYAEYYASRIAALSGETVAALGPTSSLAEVMAYLASQSEDSTVAFEDFVTAVYGSRAAIIAWKRELASSRSSFANLLGTLEETGLTIGDLELAAYDLGDQLLNVAYQAEMLGRSQNEASAEMAAMIANFMGVARQAGFTKVQIDDLIRSLNILDRLDPRIDIAIGMDLTEIKAKIASIQRAIAIAGQKNPEAATLLSQQLRFWESMAEAFASVPTSSGRTKRGGGGGGGGSQAEATDPYAWFEGWLSDMQMWAADLITNDFAVYLAQAAGPEILDTFTSIIDDAMAMAMDKIAPEVMAKLQNLQSSFKQLADLSDLRDQLYAQIDNAISKLQELEMAYADVRREAGMFDSTITDSIAPDEMSSLDKARDAYAVYQDLLNQRNQLIQQASQYKQSVATGMMAPLTAGIGGSERILRNAQEYLKNVTAMRDKGFPPDMIAEVVRAGMTDGNKLAKRLLSMSGAEVARLASIREQIAQVGLETGQIAAEVVFGTDVDSLNTALTDQQALVRSLYQQAVNDARQAFQDQQQLVTSLEAALYDTNTQIAQLVVAIQRDLTGAFDEFLAKFGSSASSGPLIDWPTLLGAISAPGYSSGSTSITVNVSGSVMSESDMIEVVRLGLLRSQAAGKPLVLT